MTSNIGKQVLNLIDKPFPRNHKFYKIFNRNTVKVSYGCMPNVAASISSHNKKILNEKSALVVGGCNCSGAICPLEGKCLTRNLLYEAEITADINNYQEKLYKGVTEPEWKKRFDNHKKSFADKNYCDDTEHSKEVWKIKQKRRNFSIKWKILKQHPAYDPVSKRCVLSVSYTHLTLPTKRIV